MAEKTGIGWTDSTWNFVTGCTRVSRGCRGCYIDRQPPFFYHGRKFDGPDAGATTGLLLHPERLSWPFREGKKALGPRVFVNSLSDVWHEQVPVELVADAFAVMAATPWLTYQVLTKRPGVMRSRLKSRGFWNLVLASDAPHKYGNGREDTFAWTTAAAAGVAPNVHLLVSVEDQKAADLRIPILLGTPGAVLGLSVEPLVAPVDLCPYVCGCHVASPNYPDQNVGWVIVGGESGPTADPMHPRWALDVLGQCADADVPAFMKQFGRYRLARDDKPLPKRHVWLGYDGREKFALDVDRTDADTVAMIDCGANAHNDQPEQWPEAFRVQQFPTEAVVT